ncbi:hypothetical protein BHE74_00010693 [Ensete ventricosum]|nr:hypothetical protein BHE74_00010693 [Ensete ventricosum]
MKSHPERRDKRRYCRFHLKSPSPHSELVQDDLEPAVKHKTSSSAPSSGASRRSSREGKNDMTNADLATKPSHPRAVGPPTWPTRRNRPPKSSSESPLIRTSSRSVPRRPRAS